MHIDFILDTVCIWSYIAKRQLESAIKNFPNTDFDICIHPFLISPPPQVYSFGLELQIDTAQRTKGLKDRLLPFLKSADIQVAFDDLPNVQDSSPSHLLIQQAFKQGKGMETLESVFHAYFTKAKDISKQTVLIEIADENELDIDLFNKILSTKSLKTILPLTWRKEGVRGVPSFIFDRKTLISGTQSPQIFKHMLELSSIMANEMN